MRFPKYIFTAQVPLDTYARRYLGQPYVEKVLEVSPERLVIDTARVDCTTLVEYCLARRMSDAGRGDFRDCVGQIRYREYEPGKTLRYADRLHYATEWVAHAEQLGIVAEVSVELGGIATERKIDFMSNHPGSYPALERAASDPEAAEDLRIIRDEIEPALSTRPFTYIPKNKINAAQLQIAPGDIILFTTSVYDQRERPGRQPYGHRIQKEGRPYGLHPCFLCRRQGDRRSEDYR